MPETLLCMCVHVSVYVVRRVGDRGEEKEIGEWIVKEKEKSWTNGWQKRRKRDRQVGDEGRGKELGKWMVKKKRKSWPSGF